MRAGVSAQVERFGGLDWPDVAARLEQWLRDVVEEASEPDLWAEIEGAREHQRGAQRCQAQPSTIVCSSFFASPALGFSCSGGSGRSDGAYRSDARGHQCDAQIGFGGRAVGYVEGCS